MALVRTQPTFAATIRAASARAGCPASLIEKDYWISEILRLLCAKHADMLVFKGGTSLSKAYQLIARFSEDIDILLDETACQSKSAKRKKISEVRKHLESMPEISVTVIAQGELNGKFACAYESVIPDALDANFPPHVIVEIGFRGGCHPAERMALNCLIGEFVQEQFSSEYADLQYFDLRVLAKQRTLFEKLFALHAAHKKSELRSKTRHFADIDALFADDEIQIFLSSADRYDISADIERINQQYFGETDTFEDVLASRAFELSGSELDDITRAFNSEKHLYYKQRDEFAPIYKRVREHLSRLHVTRRS